MTRYLIDTNVISELMRPSPSQPVQHWFEQADVDALFASVITLGEIRRGIENLPEGKRRYDLEHWLEIGLPSWFESNLLPITNQIADRWGRLTIQAKRRGMMLTTADGLIAATALEHKFTLITRNVKDFDGLGLPILNPWTSIRLKQGPYP